MTKVDFYTGSEDKLRTACQLSHKAMQSGVRVILSAPDAAIPLDPDAARQIRAIVETADRELRPKDGQLKDVSRPETTFLVTNMMRSVLNEGTAAGARSAGFSLDAAGKTGTTNDQRDAWFIGFTPELLTVVWVGLDSNQPLGLTGSQAALPIWTTFMKRALVGRPSLSFDVPPDVTFVNIDKTTGKLAAPLCPVVIPEAFLPGTEPAQPCDLHGQNGLQGFFSKLKSIFTR